MKGRRLLLLTLVFYLPLVLLSIAFLAWRIGPAAIPSRLWSDRPLVDLVLGLSIGALASLLSILLARSWRAAKQLEEGLSELLGEQGLASCAALALISGISEELCFRAVLQPELGLIPCSLLFGFVHFPPERRLLLWPVFAALMGLVLGLLYEWTGAVLAPAAAHVGVNFLNLRRLARAPNDSGLGPVELE